MGCTQSHHVVMTPRERAEVVKETGNDYFQKNDYTKAIDSYSKAIEICPDVTTFRTNRALCNFKLGKWKEVIEDCQVALKEDKANAKASYLLGVSYVRESCLKDGIEALENAFTFAHKDLKFKSYAVDITVELRRAKKALWEVESSLKKSKLEALKPKINESIEYARELELVSPKSIPNANRLHEEYDSMLVTTENLFTEQIKLNCAQEIPDIFLCPISKEIMMDPVITPDGLTYDRKSIVHHLKNNGQTDPLTRNYLSLDRIYPNVGLRSTIEAYLDKNPWAFEK